LESTDPEVLDGAAKGTKQSKAHTLAGLHCEPLEGNDAGEIYLLCGNRSPAAAQQVFLYFGKVFVKGLIEASDARVSENARRDLEAVMSSRTSERR
jgi:hypothetical protein